MLLFLLACRCLLPDEPQHVSFDRPVLQQVGGRFHDEPDAPLVPEVAFQVGARCPRITVVDTTYPNDAVIEVRVEGSGFEQITRVSAALVDGSLADVSFSRDGGVLVFPVACSQCEEYLGIDAGGRSAACMGPGYSLRFMDRRVVPQAS